jgi:cytoskeletal protein CcmA (bactofilin family)
MWKKEGMPDEPVRTRPEAPQTFERPTPPRVSGERATIGRSITIQGEVTGDEDLLIQGRVEGSVNLKQHSVTVGAEGEVMANVTGRVVTVEGRVEGDLRAEEQVILRSSAVVQGDITAPRVVLEDGARFRGGVDMGETVDRTARSTSAPQPSASGRPAAGESAGRPTSTDEEKRAASAKPEGASQTAAQATR